MATSNSFGNSQSSSTSSSRIVPGALSVYNQLLRKNTRVYNDMVRMGAEAQNNLSAEKAGISQGYTDLTSQVMKMLGVDGGGWGVADPARRDILDNMRAAQGKSQQQMINAGLGNSTVLAQATNLNSYLGNRNIAALGADLANKAAGYLSTQGLVKQDALMKLVGLQTGLAQSNIGNVAGFRFRNEAGPLIGSFSQSTSSSQQGSQSESGGGSGGGGISYGGSDGMPGGGLGHRLVSGPSLGMDTPDFQGYGGMGSGNAGVKSSATVAAPGYFPSNYYGGSYGYGSQPPATGSLDDTGYYGTGMDFSADPSGAWWA